MARAQRWTYARTHLREGPEEGIPLSSGRAEVLFSARQNRVHGRHARPRRARIPRGLRNDLPTGSVPHRASDAGDLARRPKAWPRDKSPA